MSDNCDNAITDLKIAVRKFGEQQKDGGRELSEALSIVLGYIEHLEIRLARFENAIPTPKEATGDATPT